jgi:hypothetical protein
MNRKLMVKLAMLTGAGALLASTSTASAQSADALIDKLVEKGVLNVKEANELREDADKNFTQAYSVKSGMPEWVNSLKLNGDFRGRFEGFYADNPAFVDRNRWRYRLRFGVTASLLDGFEVGFRLGSGDIDSYPLGGTDPISNNQTLQNNASKKGIFLDLAYGKYTPWNNQNGSAAFTFGKMENPFVFSDMVFDADYTPEGFGAQAAFNLSDQHVLKLNGGAFVLDEIGGSTKDPYLFGLQLREDAAWTKKLTSSVGIAILDITSEETLANPNVPNINVGNTRSANGAPTYNLNPIVADASLTYSLDSAPLYTGAFPIRVGGDFMYNGGAPDSADNHAWSAGVTFGKAGKRKTWELAYTYKWLGANAWWEELTDSDFGAYWKSGPPNSVGANATAAAVAPGYYAGTDVRGHIVKFSYSPYDFLTLSAKWFYTDLVSDSFTSVPNRQGSTTMNRIQVDATLKF